MPFGRGRTMSGGPLFCVDVRCAAGGFSCRRGRVRSAVPGIGVTVPEPWTAGGLSPARLPAWRFRRSASPTLMVSASHGSSSVQVPTSSPYRRWCRTSRSTGSMSSTGGSSSTSPATSASRCSTSGGSGCRTSSTTHPPSSNERPTSSPSWTPPGWIDLRVVGASEGGLIAQLFAAQHPERVDRLVLINTHPGRSGMIAVHRDPDGSLDRLKRLGDLFDTDGRHLGQRSAVLRGSVLPVELGQRGVRALVRALGATVGLARRHPAPGRQHRPP